MNVPEESYDVPEDLELWDKGLWRVWDNGAVVAWLSTSFFAFHETGKIDWLLKFKDESGQSDGQPWTEGLARLGSSWLHEVEHGSLTADVLGPSRTFKVTYVNDDEFKMIAKDH